MQSRLKIRIQTSKRHADSLREASLIALFSEPNFDHGEVSEARRVLSKSFSSLPRKLWWREHVRNTGKRG